MQLAQLIDFSMFNDNNFESISDNRTTYIKIRNKKADYYIDHEIENYKEERNKCIKKATQMAEQLRSIKIDSHKFKKLKNTYLHGEDFEINQQIFYRSESYYIFFFRLVYEDVTLGLTAVLNRSAKEYFIIGSDDEKYFIHSHLFTYADSNGIASCDQFLVDPAEMDSSDAVALTSESTPEEIHNCICNTTSYLIQSMKNN